MKLICGDGDAVHNTFWRQSSFDVQLSRGEHQNILAFFQNGKMGDILVIQGFHQEFQNHISEVQENGK